MSDTRSRALDEVVGGHSEKTRDEVIRQRKVRTVLVMAVVVAMFIAGLAFVSYNVYDIYASSRAKSDYESTYDAYVASVNQLDESLVSVSYTVSECRNSVADEKVCDELERLNAQALELSNLRLPKSDIHDKTTAEIREEIRRVEDKRNTVTQVREALLSALEPVAQSQVDKVKVSLNEAIKEAEGVIAQAQKIVDQTRDEVTDPAVHEEALEAIEAVRAQIDGVNAVTGTDTATYVAALNSLKQATETLRVKANAVVYSHQQWEQERLEAEAQASAEAEASGQAENERADSAREERERARHHDGD